MQKVKKALVKARNLIKKGWTKKEYSRNKYGHAVKVDNQNACKYCVLGAFYKAANCTPEDTNEVYNHMVSHFQNSTGIVDIIGYNDDKSTKKEDVIKLFNKTIKEY